MEFDDAAVIVTGSGGAIGREIALALAKSGCKILCTDVDPIRMSETVEGARIHSAEVAGVAGDVTKSSDVRHVASEALSRFGRVDALINAAGLFHARGPTHEVDIETWWNDVTTNLYGTFAFSHAVLPHMIERNRGTIINFSGAGFGSAVAGGSAYVCAKTAIIRLTETMAAELGGYATATGVRGLGSEVVVVAIDPPFVDSEMTRGLARGPIGSRWFPFIEDGFAAGKTCSASEVGEAVRDVLAYADSSVSGLVWKYDEDVRKLARSSAGIRDRGEHQLRVALPQAR